MKIHSFTLILVGLVLLSSVSYAEGVESLDRKTISGTEFTLLSNTNQCLSNCEAWIKWDLSKGILTDVQLPAEKTSQFNFEITKKNAGTKGLEDFGIEVWEELSTIVIDYADEEYNYDYSKIGLGEETCEDIGCVDKDKDFCDCVGKRRKEIGSHVEYNWEKISDSFYGFKAVKGKVYRLRIWGTKKASLEENAVDWIPTFFGEKISEWAWWNGNWIYKIPITLTTSEIIAGDVTQDLVIPIDINSEQTSFWDSVQSDGDDVRFVAASEITELNFYPEQFDYDNNKMVAHVEITDTFEAAADMTIYVYFGNVAATSGAKFRRDVYPDLYMAGWDFNESTGTTGLDVVDADTNNLTHNNTPNLDVNGIVNGAIEYGEANKNSDTGTLLDTEISELSISYLFNSGDGFDIAELTHQVLLGKTNSGTNYIELTLLDSTGSLLWRIKSGGVEHNIQSTKAIWDANTYYHVTGTFSSVTNTTNLYINGTTTDGGTLAEAMAVIAAGAGGDFHLSAGVAGFEGIIDETRVYNRVLTPNEVLLIYSSEVKGLQSFGSERSMIPDLNIAKTINGEMYSSHPIFTYVLDGNITIDFNVFQKANARLTLDLNYGNPNQGQGNVIVEDLNLDSSICTNQDWDVITSTCSYNWDYSSVDDGNYALTGLVKTSTGLVDFNTSDANFQIVNDVNIIVLAPIDEDTGFLIPSLVVGSTIGYSVKLTTEDSVKFYDDLIDLNGFVVNFQSTPVLVKVDVNVADQYYSRQYSISITEAISVYTLQPYLAPVAESGNFIFYVTNLTTTGPLSDVTITIEGIVPGEDEVVIQEIITDAAGTATIPLLLDTEYTATFIYEGEIVHVATVTPTAGSLTYRVGLDISAIVDIPDPIGALQVKWSPTTLFLLQKSTGVVDINATINLLSKTIGDININIYDSNGCLYYNFVYTNWTDGNTAIFNIDVNDGTATNIYTGTTCIFDSNTNIHSMFVTIDANSTDGNNYSARSVNWTIVQLNNYQWSLLYRLGITANALNPPGTKIISSIVSFFIVFIAVFAASKTVGNAFFTAMVGLILLGFCVYFGWFDFVIFAFIAMATIFYSMYTWGKTG